MAIKITEDTSSILVNVTDNDFWDNLIDIENEYVPAADGTIETSANYWSRKTPSTLGPVTLGNPRDVSICYNSYTGPCCGENLLD
jgi:hypothetical protein